MATLISSVVTVSQCALQLAATAPWWDVPTARWVGGTIGTAIGLCGAVIGVCAGVGRGRRVALSLMKILIALATAAVVVGLMALAVGQPYAVYYPLLLGGYITAIVSGANYRVVRRRFQQIELRKMQATDIG